VNEEVVSCVNQAVPVGWTVNEGVECCERGSGVVVIFVAVVHLYVTAIFFVFFSTTICCFWRDLNSYIFVCLFLNSYILLLSIPQQLSAGFITGVQLHCQH
jgi:hypothetical protein